MLPVSRGYRPQSADTSIEFERVEFKLLRQRSLTQRLHMGLTLRQSARRLSLVGLRQRFGQLDRVAFAQKVAITWWQADWPVMLSPGEDRDMWLGDPLEIMGKLQRLLGGLGIDYFVTGGVAAIAYGEPRTTRDIDVVITLELAAIDELVAGFYVAGIDDLRSGRGGMLQIIHQETLERADLMVTAGAFDQSRLARRRQIEVLPGQFAYFSAPEDLVLSKLLWHRDSGSEKQWRDVLGVLKVQGETLDLDYLQDWAQRLGVAAVLSEALVQAGFG